MNNSSAAMANPHLNQSAREAMRPLCFNTGCQADRIELLEGALRSCKTILGNMAEENTVPWWAPWRSRWPISAEPLRSDARNALPLIRRALGYER